MGGARTHSGHSPCQLPTTGRTVRLRARGGRSNFHGSSSCQMEGRVHGRRLTHGATGPSCSAHTSAWVGCSANGCFVPSSVLGRGRAGECGGGAKELMLTAYHTPHAAASSRCYSRNARPSHMVPRHQRQTPLTPGQCTSQERAHSTKHCGAAGASHSLLG